VLNFLVHAATHNAFYHQRHLTDLAKYKQLRVGSFEAWAMASAAAQLTRCSGPMQPRLVKLSTPHGRMSAAVVPSAVASA
jgi:hypothetical protein